jgi:DnaJ-class molecular chaperone
MSKPAPCHNCNDTGVVMANSRDHFKVCPACKGETFARQIQPWRYNAMPDRDDC